MEQSGQQSLLRDLGALESAIAQPRQMFGAEDLYPGLAGKAAALRFSLIQNHPFVDGNGSAMPPWSRFFGSMVVAHQLKRKSATDIPATQKVLDEFPDSS